MLLYFIFWPGHRETPRSTLNAARASCLATCTGCLATAGVMDGPGPLGPLALRRPRETPRRGVPLWPDPEPQGRSYPGGGYGESGSCVNSGPLSLSGRPALSTTCRAPPAPLGAAPQAGRDAAQSPPPLERWG